MTPLDDIVVLDVTQMVSGPFTSMMLADMGAEVLKIERPDGGELGRSNPPFTNGRSEYFTSVNRNKKSVALDLKSDRGREAFLDLAAEADVVVENNPAGRMERFGLGYDAVRERNESVVYCSVTGFGQTGPYRELPALDIVAQAMSGVMSMTGPPDGEPYRAGVPIGDLSASMYAAQSVLLALYTRERTGEGEYVDVSMLDSTLSWLTVRAGYTFGTGERYPRRGNELDEFIPYGVFETRDSHVAVVVAADHQWRRLCEALDRPDLAADERYATTAGRRVHRDELEATLTEAFRDGTADEWFERLSAQKVPVAPIYDTKEVWNDEHVRARDLIRRIGEADDDVRAIRHPVSFGRTETSIRRGVPELGEHTREALERVGYDADAIAAYEDAITPREEVDST